MPPSNSRVDAIGERLRRGVDLTPEQAADLRAFLDERDAALLEAVGVLRSLQLNGRALAPAARLKTLATILEKLRRERNRLSSIQDIAGARVVVPGGIREQDAVTALITEAFAESRVIDRRSNPSHGYRAVHLVVRCHGSPVEIQVRTQRQQQWAELFEGLADRVGREIRYGGVPSRGVSAELAERLVAMMMSLSEHVALTEAADEAFSSLQDHVMTVFAGVEEAERNLRTVQDGLRSRAFEVDVILEQMRDVLESVQ